jgi:alanine racemase
MQLYRKTYAKIDLGAIKDNVRNLRNNLPDGCEMIGVVKADAYGHGAEQVADAVLRAGAGAIAVELPEEGAALRAAGIKGTIFVIGGANREQARLSVDNGLIQCVFDREGLETLNEEAEKKGVKAVAHIKCDTGWAG